MVALGIFLFGMASTFVATWVMRGKFVERNSRPRFSVANGVLEAQVRSFAPASPELLFLGWQVGSGYMRDRYDSEYDVHDSGASLLPRFRCCRRSDPAMAPE